MLREISSNSLIKEKIIFTKGLNIVLGDNSASNSIGKSTFLMILDLIFGGKSYLEYNADVFLNIGEHEINFKFKFGEECFYFKKKIFEKKQLTYKSNSNYTEEKLISDDEYKNFLKEKYLIKGEGTSFREVVSLYSRIWGKNNYFSDKPLQGFKKETDTTSMVRLIKLYDKYDLINEKEKEKRRIEKKGKALKMYFDEKIIKKINRKEYEKNKKRLNEVLKEKESLKEDSLAYLLERKGNSELKEKYLNLSKKEKEYQDKELIINLKIANLKNRKLKKNKITEKEIQKIQEIFPNVNLSKLNELENFHENISEFLDKEIELELKKYSKEKEIIEKKLLEIALEISFIINGLSYKTEELVSNIQKILIEETELSQNNFYYEESGEIKVLKEKITQFLFELKLKLLNEIAYVINKNMKIINHKLYENHESPTIEIYEKTYKFGIKNNTGTGRSYENLIVFDLAVLKTSQLPLLIHDSFLFKNLSIDLMQNILLEYLEEEKQIFIALDEINRYDKKTQEIICKKQILELSKDNCLFKKSWGK
ncbi:MAG: DUF2326 domain-containing protein [Fusobacteriaceae bacterium]